jgi:hypothetical protein
MPLNRAISWMKLNPITIPISNPHWLVVLTILRKYEFVNGKDDIPYMKWTIKAMFETTNQNHH